MKTLWLLLLLALSSTAYGQEHEAFSRSDTFSISAEYANTSSHILLGRSEARRLAEVGFAYSRRLRHTRFVDWSYDLELHPARVIADPTLQFTLLAVKGVPVSVMPASSFPVLRPCTPGTYTINFNPPSLPPSTITYALACGRRWTYAGGVSPLGQRLNFAPRHRIQSFITGNGGFAASNRDLPTRYTSRFNFTFEFGIGLQYYRDHQRSWSVEYRIHHLSNDYIGTLNPGIDNQAVKLTYSFGH